MIKKAANLMMLVLCEMSLTCMAAQKQLGTVVLPIASAMKYVDFIW